MKPKWSNVFLFTLLCFRCGAQTTGYKNFCLLDTVRNAGFYNIALTPEINAHIKTDYSDIRIVNKEGKWVPHLFVLPANIIHQDIAAFSLPYEIMANSKVNTIVTIKSARELTSNIGLTIKNTAAKRFCTLSGSDDKKNWFVINDSILLNSSAERDSAVNTIRIDFPPSSYQYFRIIIFNDNKDPFNIRNIVQESHAGLPKIPVGRMIQNPAPTIIQKDSGKISYVKIIQQKAYHLNNISFKLSGPKYFYRQADLYIPYRDISSFSNPGKLIQSFTVSNNSTLQFKLPLINPGVFYLMINNDDNLPLIVNNINTASDYSYLVAYLEKGDGYKLIMDNPAATKPAYDLSHLNNAISSDSNQTLSTGEIIAANEKIIPAVIPKNKKWLLWTAIAVILLLLLFFTKKMITEVDKTKHNDNL
jgi:hypothetical protein